LGFDKSQRSVTHDSLRCINILTYLLLKELKPLPPINEALKIDLTRRN